ncbi:MAG: GGDEF domain-containing protein [Colwellia sp.]
MVNGSTINLKTKQTLFVWFFVFFAFVITTFFISSSINNVQAQTSEAIATATLTATTLLNENLSFTQQLELADSIRSKNPAQFDAALTRIYTQQQHLSVNEKHYLHYLSAYQATIRGEFDQAKSVLSKLDYSTRNNPISIRAKALLVDIYAATQQWQQGLTSLAQILSLLPNLNNTKKQIILSVSTTFYSQLGQYQLALSYAKKLNYAADDYRNQCLKKTQILIARFKLKQLNLFNKAISSTINFCKQTNEKIIVSALQSYQAENFLNKSEYTQAITLLTENLPATQATKYPFYIAKFNALLAKAYWQLNNKKQTEKYALAALKEGKNISNAPFLVSAYQLLYQLAEQKNNYQQALHYYVKYSEANQNYIDETQAKHLAFQLAEHQNFASKNEIKLLNKQNKLLNTQHLLSSQKQENSILLIMLLLGFLLALALWAYKAWVTQDKLRQLTEYDGLTQVFSRGHFVQLANSALTHCQKSDQEISCVMFDLDRFKNINDTYGHAVGDKVLKQTIIACKTVGRYNDIFGRLGGEEFAILLPGCSIAIAKDIANQCRQVISEIDPRDFAMNSPITASFGVTDSHLSGFDLENMLIDADGAMYSSKHHGRNRVTVFR